MTNTQIAKRLKVILAKGDLEPELSITRKKSTLHDDKIDVLLDQLSLMVVYLRFDAEASRKEVFSIRKLLENV